jgi:malonyl-CoA O-methyltransferase
MSPSSFLDVATGTGYWLGYALDRGLRAFGLDLSSEMLHQAAHKPGLSRRLVQADMNTLPLQDSVADVAVCSFALGYLPGVETALRELARVAHHVIVSDLHEHAIAAGWNRCFQHRGRQYRIQQFEHTAHDLDQAAARAGLRIDWRESSFIGEPERMFFVRAGREYAFENACSIPALLSTCWSRA